MCFNRKVIGGLVVVALGIYLVTPSAFASALPLLLVAACPLSMLLMGKSMMGVGNKATIRDHTPAAPGIAAASRSVEERQPTEGEIDHIEHVALVRAQLRRVGEQQATLTRQLDALQAAEATTQPPESTQEAEQALQRTAARV
jgi:hypothetical protein